MTPRVATTNEDQSTASNLDEIRFDANLEQKQNGPDFRGNPQHLTVAKRFERGNPEKAEIAEEDAHQKLHGRLA